jgi:hypothetical protein
LQLPVLSGQLRGLFDLRRDTHTSLRSFFWWVTHPVKVRQLTAKTPNSIQDQPGI